MNHKIIILGPQCSGKTTLTRYLRKNYENLPIVEEDELFTELNGGEYPEDVTYKENELRPKLEEKIRASENMIFLSSYCNPVLLREFRAKGYKIFQLVLNRDEFNRRNEKRMRDEGYADANVWAKQVFGFHDEVKEQGLADMQIDATLPVEEIAKIILVSSK